MLSVLRLPEPRMPIHHTSALATKSRVVGIITLSNTTLMYAHFVYSIPLCKKIARCLVIFNTTTAVVVLRMASTYMASTYGFNLYWLQLIWLQLITLTYYHLVNLFCYTVVAKKIESPH